MQCLCVWELSVLKQKYIFSGGRSELWKFRWYSGDLLGGRACPPFVAHEEATRCRLVFPCALFDASIYCAGWGVKISCLLVSGEGVARLPLTKFCFHLPNLSPNFYCARGGALWKEFVSILTDMRLLDILLATSEKEIPTGTFPDSGIEIHIDRCQ